MMKRILRFSGILAVTITVLSACQKDVEEDPNLNYRGEFLGVWTALETGSINGSQSYSVNISAGNEEDEIVLSGLYNMSAVKVNATVSGYNISIPQQTSDGITFEGSGQAVASFENINMNFTANDGAQTDEVGVQLTR